jgi:tryptophan synthase beta chain
MKFRTFTVHTGLLYLHRAFNLEKALDTPARIYYKYEGTSQAGSHKLNTAIAQAYYNKKEGLKESLLKLARVSGAVLWQWDVRFSILSARYIW